jgi:hypothetical protein
MYLSGFCNRPLVFTLLGIGLLVWACKTTQSKENIIDEARELAIDKLGNDIESFPNSTEEYNLYVQKTNSSNTSHVLKFLIIETTANNIILEQSFAPGYVKWVAEFSIEILSVPGNIKETENLSDYIKIIDVRSIKP